MLQGDEVLFSCNESELLWMARTQGLPPLRMGLPRERLVAIVAGDDPRPEEVAGTEFTRTKLEAWVQKNIQYIRGQLPGCNGMCRTFPCSEVKHMSCYVPNELVLL